MDLKELLGEDLYNQVTKKVGDHKLAVVSDGNWIPKEKFDEKNNEVKGLKEQIAEHDTQLEQLSEKAKGHDGLQETISALKEANEAAKAQYQQELQQTKLNYELDQALLVNRARNPRAVKALIDTEIIKLDEEGKLVGLTEQLEAVRESDPYLFDGDDNQQPPAANHIPGATNKTNNPKPADTYATARERVRELLKK